MTTLDSLLSAGSDHPLFDRRHRRADASAWSVESGRGAVATAHYLATAAGAEALAGGGNAIDAAAAASLALGVCEPAGSGLGGMTLMLVHLAASGRTFAIEGSCRAPIRATPEEVARSPRRSGPKAIAVPTTPAVLAHAIRRYGALSERDALAPAIEIAERGFPVGDILHGTSIRYRRSLARRSGARFFLDASGEVLAIGGRFRQPVLAATLSLLSEVGLQDYYDGQIGREIASDLESQGGFIRADDLEDVPWPSEREALTVELAGGPVEGWNASTLAPPAGGFTLLEMLRLFAELPDGQNDPDTPAGAVHLARIIRRARLDRMRRRLELGHGDFRAVDELLDARRCREVAELLAAGDIDTEPLVAERSGEGETTHVSVADGHGNVVAMTQSLERCFGSKVVSPKLGFLYNGYLRAFKVENRRHPHFLRPGAVARSNACPTIVFRGGEPFAALGSTGSERMASGIFLVLARLALGTDPFEAVHAPRFHATPDARLLVERGRVGDEVIGALEEDGLTIEALEDYSFQTGGLQLVTRERGLARGVADPRRDGAPGGPEVLSS